MNDAALEFQTFSFVLGWHQRWGLMEHVWLHFSPLIASSGQEKKW